MRWCVALSCSLLAACGPEVVAPRDQWRVVLSTDAPVPQFGDRLLVEVLDDQGNACSGCRRQLGAADPTAWPQSFGIVAPESGGRLRVRARLYRTATTGDDGLPGTALLVDALGELPDASGITEVSLVLGMSCFGAPADVAANTTCDPASGQVVSAPVLPLLEGAGDLPAPGSWEPARPVDCAGPGEDSMVCVHGGALLLGAPEFLYPLGDELRPFPEQLVRLSPFWIDRQEFTVGEIRVLAGMLAPLEQGLDEKTELCTYVGPADASNDAHPVNCITRELAAAACEARGKQLPTEAQWEWAAGNLAKESAFPWLAAASVTTADICEHAVVGAGRPSAGEAVSCFEEGVAPGPRPGGHEADLTALGVGNLGGNVSEWTSDSIAAFDDPACWASGAALVVDPRCEIAGETRHVIRGGSWADKPRTAVVYLRNGGDEGASASVGFRCVRPDVP